MRPTRATAVLFTCSLVCSFALGAQSIVLRTSRLIDGKGNTLANQDILVENGKITKVGPRGAVPAGAQLIDLGARTVLPGLIDAHSHPTWYFNKQGRYHTNQDGDTPEMSMQAYLENAKATVMAGFTTIQSPGSSEDLAIRQRLASVNLPGPRILTSLNALNNQRTTPDSFRAIVRQRKQQGADLIKIFASASIRDGGKQTLSQEQLDAICSEAKASGLRTIVHAHSAESVQATVKAGCNQVEHGIFVTQAELDLMAQKNVYFDPQCSLVFRNYLDNRAKYEGIGNYNEAGFAAMEKAIPLAADDIRKAIATKGLKVVYGTDAVAGAHGHNAEDMVCRVQSSGESPMHVITSATSLNAEALGLGKEIGSIAAGYEADIIAVDGNPLTDITAVRKVRFVMRGGKVLRKD